jgi:hypothetical protein
MVAVPWMTVMSRIEVSGSQPNGRPVRAATITLGVPFCMISPEGLRVVW